LRRSVRSTVETRVNRVRRRSRRILVEIGKTVLLIACVAVIASLLIFAYNFVIVSPYFQMKETLVRGTERLQSDAVVELTGLKPSQNILMTNLGAVATQGQGKPLGEGRLGAARLPRPARHRGDGAQTRGPRGAGRRPVLHRARRHGLEKIAAGEKTDLPVLTGFYRKGARTAR
jgi:hypothetical protein